MMLPLLLLGLLAAQDQPAEDPLAPVREGKVQCYSPDTARKTCAAIGSYKQQPDGSWISTALQQLPIPGGIQLEVETAVLIKDGAICGPIRREDLIAGKLITAEGAMPPEQAGPILEQIAAAMGPLFGKMICTHYVPNGDILTARVSIDGTPMPELNKPVRWVGADEGYTAAPPPHATGGGL